MTSFYGIGIACAVVAAACTRHAQAQTAEWRLLFDAKTFAGWRGLGYDRVPSAHWKIENGAIKKIATGQVPRMADGQPATGGDLMTRDTFGDFELTWEWKISPGGNSGVKYNVSEELSMAAAPNHAALGFEYQLLDDSIAEDRKVPSHRAAALYDLIAPNARTRQGSPRPEGERKPVHCRRGKDPDRRDLPSARVNAISWVCQSRVRDRRERSDAGNEAVVRLHARRARWSRAGQMTHVQELS
jgi:hypothetical protein